MNFKDIVQNDVETVFLNMEEFAEEHSVDGVPMKVIIDNNELLEREKRQQALEDGIFRKQVLFYVSAIEFGRLPKVGRRMVFDEKPYTVKDAIREGAMYSILLEANKS